jgi:hypothetical protein
MTIDARPHYVNFCSGRQYTLGVALGIGRLEANARHSAWCGTASEEIAQRQRLIPIVVFKDRL